MGFPPRKVAWSAGRDAFRFTCATTARARSANLNVETDSSTQSAAGASVATNRVTELPPNESRNRRVSFDSL